tara:strand:- start:3024 stop:3296 length:273 start_codon:yes stop_codon:yes gene_type:complete
MTGTTENETQRCPHCGENEHLNPFDGDCPTLAAAVYETSDSEYESDSDTSSDEDEPYEEHPQMVAHREGNCGRGCGICAILGAINNDRIV